MGNTLLQEQEREFARLRAGRNRLLKIGAVALCAIAIIATILTAWRESPESNIALQATRRALSGARADWAQDLLQQHSDYREWILNHGIGFESRLFDRIAGVALREAVDLASSPEDGFLHRARISFNSALLRLSFLLISSMRLWIVIILVSIVLSFYKFRVYLGSDLLGETGNGRLFYSGIRQGIEKVDSRGVPEALVTGLACAPRADSSSVSSSAIGRVLAYFKIGGNSAENLAGFIVAAPDTPGYVSTREESPLLEKAYKGEPLIGASARALMCALELHREYKAGRGLSGEKDLAVFGPVPPPGTMPLDADQYAALLQRALHRVLTKHMREELAKLPAEHIATAVLALESGKIMAYGREGTRWIRSSNFPQLCARAMLHSLPTFHKEFNAADRTTIRRALVYASRRSAFAPVRFPIDLSDESRALRQWLEVLLACPHELAAVSDDVELFGILYEGNKAWSDAFLDAIMMMSPELVQGIFATPGNLLCVPLRSILTIMRPIVPRQTMARLEELITQVGQRQRIEGLAIDPTKDVEEGTGALYEDRVVPPISFQEIKQLANIHGLLESEVRDWSSLRAVLSASGWIARRVGDFSVPQSALIFGVFKTDPGSYSSNAQGIFGKPGMIPLRATRISQKFGRNWQSRFSSVDAATMAETPEEFSRRLVRFEEAPVNEEGSEV